MPHTREIPDHIVFMDRDGVINVERGDYTTTIGEWEWAPNAREGIALLTRAGIGVIVITNQACIAKGLQTEKGLAELHGYLVEEVRDAGGDILGIYHCPHVDEDACGCRKPQPGMILEAARDYRTSLGKSFMIGDSPRDIEAGIRAGTRTIRIVRPGEHENAGEEPAAEFQAADLLDAARIVVREIEAAAAHVRRKNETGG